jgi:inner membrane protein
MENLAHSLCGAALARTRLGRMHRLAPISLLVAANLPDIDIVSGLFGQQSYLLHHRGITHSVVGVLVLALLLAGAMRWLERERVDAPRRWRAYLLPALVGVATHPLLDLLNNYGLRPWLPFSDARYFGDLVFIVDPWLCLLFGGVALLAGRRSPTVDFVFGVVAVAAIAIVWSHHLSPQHLRVAFPVGVVLLALLRKGGVGVRRPQFVLAGGALLVAGYLGLLLGCRTLAVDHAMARPDPALSSLQSGGAAPRLAMCSPAIADPFHWSLCFEGGSQVVWRTVGLDGAEVAGGDALGDGAPLLQPFDDPLVKAVSRSDAAAPWRDFARVPWGWVERWPDGSARVGLSDARYQRTHGRGWCTVEVDLTAAEVTRIMESGGTMK